jgi:flagellum-specific ATP synthase
MGNVSPREQVELARRARGVLARVGKARDLIQLGAYQPGHDPELDQALQVHGPLVALLQQDMHDRATLAQSRAQLARVMN